MAIILVTGASGFVGRHLVDMLVSRGDQIVLTTRRIRSGLAANSESGMARSCSWIEISMNSSDKEWSDVLRGVNFVIHLGARVHVMNENAKTALPNYLESNTELTKRIASIALKQGVDRFVFVSTVKVLGEKTTGKPFATTSIANPQDPYSESKYRAENALREVCALGKMDFVIVRPTLVVGNGASGNLERLIKWIASGLPIALGGILNERSLVSVETLCQILVESMENSNVGNETLLAADSFAISTPEIVRCLASGYGKRVRLWSVPRFLMALIERVPLIGSSISRLSESLVVDASETYGLLEWTPTVSIQERLRIVGEKYCDQIEKLK